MAASVRRALTCPRCRNFLSPESLTSDGETVCASCGAGLRTLVFPAFCRPPEKGSLPAPLLTGEEAACYYHAAKQAAAVCDACGRFLCALCRIEIKGRTLCPGCLESGSQERFVRNLTRRRILHDEVALSLAVLPLLAWPLTIATAPTAVFWALRHWNSASSLLPRSKKKYVLAIVIASLEITAWVAGISFMIWPIEV